MFILRELLTPLQDQFSTTQQGQQRKVWFVYTLLAIITPFTSSMTSNLLRTLNTLFGMKIKSQRYYTFMATSTLPWKALWKTLWGLILSPATCGRIMVAVDDSINTKTGRRIFACDHFHDHASKGNQTSYPWSQCILAVGLLKKVKSRWVCIPLDFKFYIMQKLIDANLINCQIKGQTVPFETKMAQAAKMLQSIYHFFQQPVLIVCDSWFGNDGLWSLLERGQGGNFQLLSRLRSNITLYDLAPIIAEGQTAPVGAPRKYGKRVGSANDCAQLYRKHAKNYTVDLYGKKREVLAYSRTMMLKTLKCQIRIVWVYRKTRYVALFTTDLSLSIKQIIEYYGARWKIESGFKEIKQEIGSSKTQARTADSVINHLNFCMMATTLTWIYADRLQYAPDRKHKIRGRASFAFSDVRKILSEAALDPDFKRVCPVPFKAPVNSFVKMLLRMVA